MRHLICVLLLSLAAPVALAALDLNTATEAELDALPGVGPSRAQAIIDYRRTHGPFVSVDDLRSVKGIGDKTFADLRPLLVVAPPSPAASSSAGPVSAAPVSGGVPWVWLIAGVVVAIVVIVSVFMRRRAAPVSIPAEAPVAQNVPVRPATGAPPPRPEASAPVRTAGAPPRPAGSAAAPPSTVSPVAAPSAAPKPAGAPPKPAGSR